MSCFIFCTVIIVIKNLKTIYLFKIRKPNLYNITIASYKESIKVFEKLIAVKI